MTDRPKIRALDALMNDHIPRWYGIGPRWYTDPPAIDRQVRVPNWSWRHPDYEKHDPADLVTLDVNGAYLAVLSGAKLSLSALKHTGPLKYPDHRLPGYYLVDVHRWQDTRIVSPLGDSKLGAKVWITAPTLEILQQLSGENWPETVVHDSWTAPEERNGRGHGVTRLANWAAWLKELREAALDSGDPEYREDVKDAYGAAINMLLGNAEGADRKSKIRRPDWNRTIRAAHSANQWRKAWRSLARGCEVLAMGNTDELTYHHDHVEILAKLATEDPKAPIKFDLTGRQLGAFKIKAKEAQA